MIQSIAPKNRLDALLTPEESVLRRNSPRSRRRHGDRFRLGAAASGPEDGRIPALQYVVVDQPKAACQESSFACGQAVAGVLGFVPQNEFILDQKSIQAVKVLVETALADFVGYLAPSSS